MADPVVHLTNGIPDSGTGNITTLGQTLLDGAQVTQGAIADAAVTAGATGTISAKLRSLSRDIGSLVTAIGSTAWDLGVGTGGSRTQRIAIDTASQNANGTTTDLNSTPVAWSTEGKAQMAAIIAGITALTADTTSTGNITVVDSGSSSTTGQNSASIVTGTPTAASFFTQALSGHDSGRILLSGTWTGTVQFEGSMDSGTTYTPIPARVVGSVYTTSTATGNGQFYADLSGLTNFRVRATAAMTGTLAVRARVAYASGPVQLLNPARLVGAVSGVQADTTAAGELKVNATQTPATSGGLSRSRTLIPANTTAIVVKSGAGQLFKIRATNNSGTIGYIKLYDATSATAGSGTPVDTIMIPSSTSGTGIVDTTDVGAVHSTGITYIVTTGIADNDTAAPAANAYIVTMYFK